MSLIYGIDLSNNNGNVNVASAVSAGCKAAIMKASEGLSFKDKYLSSFYSQAKANNIYTGAYHFLTATTPELQAANFYNAIKSYSFDVLVLDVESNFNELSNYIQRFLTAFSSYSNQELVLYTYSGFVNNISKAALKCFNKAWIANYNKKQNLESVYNSVLAACSVDIVGHQYSDCQSFGTFTGDCNVFAGDMFGDSLPEGQWKIDNTGWWFEYSNGFYPKNQWARLPQGNNDKTPNWFLFDDEGYMLVGWQKEGGNWYLLDDPNGDMKTGWIYKSNKWYYLNDNGAMQAGWLKYNNKWYYLNKDGSMVTGWLTLNNKLYLLYSSGIMACNTIAYGYRFADDGVATKSE